jgi:hypothetical protein
MLLPFCPAFFSPLTPRAWSAAVGAAETCNVYTIRAFFGDPDATLPYWMKGKRKSDLQRMLQESGIDDTSGTKDVLLHRFQTGKFRETICRFPGRECLQRMLVVALDFWGRELGHCFTATLPARGDCPWGTKRLGELDCLWHCHPTMMIIWALSETISDTTMVGGIHITIPPKNGSKGRSSMPGL